jgi:hypothetical protein
MGQNWPFGFFYLARAKKKKKQQTKEKNQFELGARNVTLWDTVFQAEGTASAKALRQGQT